MECRKDSILTGKVSLSDEAQKDFLGICDMIATRIADDQEIPAEEVTRLAGWIEVLQGYLGEFSGIPGMTLRRKSAIRRINTKALPQE